MGKASLKGASNSFMSIFEKKNMALMLQKKMTRKKVRLPTILFNDTLTTGGFLENEDSYLLIGALHGELSFCN